MSQGVPTKFWHLGKRMTFRTLSAACAVPYKVLWRRYRDGDRGMRLVRPVESQYAHRGSWGVDMSSEVAELTSAPATTPDQHRNRYATHPANSTVRHQPARAGLMMERVLVVTTR